MADIRDWLSEIGLEAFAGAFEREQIDLSSVHTLSDANLRELGLPMGPRNKLKAAIIALSAGSSVSTPAAALVQSEAPQARAEPPPYLPTPSAIWATALPFTASIPMAGVKWSTTTSSISTKPTTTACALAWRE